MKKLVKLKRVVITEMSCVEFEFGARCECGEPTDPGELACPECLQTQVRRSRSLIMVVDCPQDYPSQWEEPTPWELF